MTKKQKFQAQRAEWSAALAEGRVVREGPAGLEPPSALIGFPTVEQAQAHLATLLASGVAAEIARPKGGMTVGLGQCERSARCGRANYHFGDCR